MGRPIIETENLGKQYRLGVYGMSTLREDLNRMLAERRKPKLADSKDYVWALRNVSFKIFPGETVGFIGSNGAGKSTLLKLLARITEPTEGTARLRGKVAALLEVGSGFHQELTGRENIFLNAAILGMSRSTTRQRLADIIEFSGVGDYIDTPVKRYSSGMRVRLAFAVAAFLDDEILIADEVLAVGDATFQRKSLRKMSEVASAGRTILFVSHDLAAVQKLCQRTIVLKKGRIFADGPSADAIRAYLDSLQVAPETDSAEPEKGDGVVVENVIINQGADTVDGLLVAGAPMQIEITVRNKQPEINYGLAAEIHSETGILLSRLETQYDLGVSPREDAVLTCEMRECLLPPGRYRLGLQIYQHTKLLRYIENAREFEVTPGHFENYRIATREDVGYVFLPHKWRSKPYQGLSGENG
jgi:lipopolysaccharide transport system ATP-binding protein